MSDNVTAVGLDLGNSLTKICVSWAEGPDVLVPLVAKIPSRYAEEKPPGKLNKSGQRGTAQAFEMLITHPGGRTSSLWFGQDTLAIPATQKAYAQKYDPIHIQILLKGALAQWEKTHKSRGVDLSKLGPLNIVASMPPVMFEDTAVHNRAKKAYKEAFNKNPQSHHNIRRPDMPTVQIVAKFDRLQQEAVAWGTKIPRDGEWVLVIDLGGGTRDFALFNGSTTPKRKGSSKNGLIDAFEGIDSLNRAYAELEVMRDKKRRWAPLMAWYSDVEMGIGRLIEKCPHPISRLFIIGGGAALMPEGVKSSMRTLAPEVTFKDEYTNARANWLAAGGKS